MSRWTTYLLHFIDPETGQPARYQHWTTDPAARLDEHARGTGARLVEVITETGLGFTLARTWPQTTRDREDLLKHIGDARRFCPECGVTPRRQPAVVLPERRRSLYELERDGTWSDGTPLPDNTPTWPPPAAHREDAEMFGRQHRAAAREHAEQEARAQAEADALFAEADRLDNLIRQPYGYRQQINAERAARIMRQLGEPLTRDAGKDGPALAGADLDAEIDRLAEAYPEPVLEPENPLASGLAPGPDATPEEVAAWEEWAWEQGERERAEARAELERQWAEQARLSDQDLRREAAAESAFLYGACNSPGCHCAYGHPDRLTAEQQATAEPGWVDAARWVPGQERDEIEAPGDLLNWHAARAEDARRREGRATADERLAQLAHDEDALRQARQAAEDARADRRMVTAAAYATAARMQRQALDEAGRDAPDHLYGHPDCAETGPETAHFGRPTAEPQDAGRFPLPRILPASEVSPVRAPVAATLSDGTPHADPFLAERGWQAQGGLYVRQPQAQLEAG